MVLAAERDRIARQYACGFSDLLKDGFQFLREEADRFPGDWHEIILRVQLRMLAVWPDSLILRKCGEEMAESVRERANLLVSADISPPIHKSPPFQELDDWLRSDGNRRNPGTTADFIAALLYVAMREGMVHTEQLQRVVPR